MEERERLAIINNKKHFLMRQYPVRLREKGGRKSLADIEIGS